MMFDGTDADEKLTGDLLARFVLADELKHSSLCGAELFELRPGAGKFRPVAMTIDEKTGKLGTDVVATRGNRPNAVDDLGHRAVFEDVSFHTQIERCV